MKVTLLSDSSGDWDAVYVDGTLQYEGHSISPFQWLMVIQTLGHHTEDREVDFEINQGAAPARLSDLKVREGR